MELTNKETLPCGCIIGDNGDAFVMQPCKPSCEYYKYFLAEAARQRKPTVWVRDTAE